MKLFQIKRDQEQKEYHEVYKKIKQVELIQDYQNMYRQHSVILKKDQEYKGDCTAC